eukprot:1151630-Pelagomonas_calceolata.AAC.1
MELACNRDKPASRQTLQNFQFLCNFFHGLWARVCRYPRINAVSPISPWRTSQMMSECVCQPTHMLLLEGVVYWHTMQRVILEVSTKRVKCCHKGHISTPWE